ncbi:MAG: DUF2141 domain-containing protein [Flavobacteriaceae bacterium]|nr:DUF2141 domain-containing protein [Flavobacteriaceae bacterium]
MMKFILFISLYLLSLIGFSQTKPQTHTITATVTNAVSDKGKVYFSLYTSKENFENHIPFAKAVSTIQEGVSKVVFTNLKSGVYAIMCFHDANNNGKMDFEPTGMPLEDYGASNNVQNFGPPLFSDAKFEVADTDLFLKIKF